MQQKYCDQGRSTVLSTITWPTRRACNSCGSGGKPRKPSSFPSMKSCIGFTDGLTTQLMSLPGSIPTCATIGARNKCWASPARLPDNLTFQVGDAVDVLFGEYFETTSMHTGQYLERHTLIDRLDAKRRKVCNKVKLATHK